MGSRHCRARLVGLRQVPQERDILAKATAGLPFAAISLQRSLRTHDGEPARLPRAHQRAVFRVSRLQAAASSTRGRYSNDRIWSWMGTIYPCSMGVLCIDVDQSVYIRSS